MCGHLKTEYSNTIVIDTIINWFLTKLSLLFLDIVICLNCQKEVSRSNVNKEGGVRDSTVCLVFKVWRLDLTFAFLGLGTYLSEPSTNAYTVDIISA